VVVDPRNLARRCHSLAPVPAPTRRISALPRQPPHRRKSITAFESPPAPRQVWTPVSVFFFCIQIGSSSTHTRRPWFDDATEVFAELFHARLK